MNVLAMPNNAWLLRTWPDPRKCLSLNIGSVGILPSLDRDHGFPAHSQVAMTPVKCIVYHAAANNKMCVGCKGGASTVSCGLVEDDVCTYCVMSLSFCCYFFLDEVSLPWDENQWCRTHQYSLQEYVT